MKQKNEKQSCVYILIAASLWGLICIFVKGLSALGLSALEIVEVRALCSAVILILLCAFRKPKLLKIQFRDLPLFLGTGIVSIVLFNTCYFFTITLSGVSVAALLLYTAPAMVMLLSIPILKERFDRRKLIALILTILGLSFVTGVFSSGEKMTVFALLTGLGSGFGYAMYSIFGKFLVHKYHSMTITTYTFLIAAIGLVPVLLLTGTSNFFRQTSVWGFGIGIAAICTVLPYLLYTRGLQNVEAGKAAVLATIEPIVATLTGVLLYRETMTAGKMLGMLCIISAIAVLEVRTLHSRY